ncbi:hypothetical protein GFC01_00880 [Desulfofundulus thermobenzoicus]|uniref:Uncharacterized protein n=1 Tax=Desulfofundulus thermobenzoicus TaxID=29376 RepID=A0A6N7ILM8_9FIRM|nr:hypothetical protein [Desulfofundulus thermobenzoicus]MQL50851.1 hypothetical protein [Desulfofundulus thermobenzoicus]
MTGRQIPGHIVQCDFEQGISFLENFLGSEWLNSQTEDSSVITKLWYRKDFLSSIELYTLAHAIQKFQNEKNARWFDKFKNHVYNHENIDIISQSYEIISAAMFYNRNQLVELCDVSKPGYDFAIYIDKKTIRVSCKKLLMSDQERLFYENADVLYHELLEYCKKIGLNGIQVFLHLINLEEQIDWLELRKNIIGCINLYSRDKNRFGFKIGGWFLGIWDMPIDMKDFCYYPNDISILFICGSPYLQDEQKRLENLIRRAARNLKKHSNTIDQDNINMIMISLPPAVSLTNARRWLMNKFNSDYSSITAVFLTRTVPTVEKDLSTMLPLNEVAFVSNPNAKVNWASFVPPGYVLSATIPFGKISEEESKMFLVADDNFSPTGEVYLFQRGQIFHEHINGPMEYTFKRIPGVQHHVVFAPTPGAGQMMVSSITPPEDAFLIL